jgi:hypothetical protein
MSRRLVLCLEFAFSGCLTLAHAQETYNGFCSRWPVLCTEITHSGSYYSGHDEPSLLFYSNTPGSGNSSVYNVRLPKDPPTLPAQNGKGGTFNFQLRPAFWLGMAMCDSQSAPNFTRTCVPDTDNNIFDDPNSASPKYIGKHPGTAFMEMQFYPPGWVKWPEGISCDAFQWCAALNIDSLSVDQNTNAANNNDCRNRVGDEPVNFAFVTRNGVALDAANPLNVSEKKFTPDPNKVLFMNSGDNLRVTLRDTAAGFQVVIEDLTTGQKGTMTASLQNGFAQIVFNPNAATCSATPYAFHPMYSTSGEHTRVPWAVHSYNVAFSDEIGHFEYCPNDQVRLLSGVDFGFCANPGTNIQRDDDDFPCWRSASSSRIAIGGCLGSDFDFDGVPYQTVWPGAVSSHDQATNPEPVQFTSPQFFPQQGNGGANDQGQDQGNTQDYDRVAFETDLPALEAACDPFSGAGCVNPPAGANFYPIYTTAVKDGNCIWQLGGAHIPGTTNTFGGTSTAEYGPLLSLVYPTPVGGVFFVSDNRRILNQNPCKSGEN